MLYLGVDVVTMMVLMVSCCIGNVVVSWIITLDEREGTISLVSTMVTSMIMLVGYVVMAAVLDGLL